ncbi:alpha/beta fold hydrolase [Pseudokineococcus lusitanus]|uniref:Pimeloyl-ACP methyl ester carboxylesterase n=1 Tax=Pseudokineococcus lusitanus TaxID=763993 RepID=A0A3N1GX33_9ACTN|nr:alpha/beta hydrolase [Pseudokineococcus lusitanus]ROP34672.1 pimeloyl-ACP methyl ester carboxylesterase [Pseudokineococcus lusitanus]
MPTTPALPGAVEHLVDVADGVRLWARTSGDPGGSPVLLVMGAASSGVVWPDALVERLGRQHRVVVWDHRDTGRSSAAMDVAPYALTDLAEDAVRVLDAVGADRAHVVGMSMGGLLAQLLLLDHPDRLLSATLFCTGPLAGAPVPEDLVPPGTTPPGPSPELLALWGRLGEERDAAAELTFRVEHWQALAGGGVPFPRAEVEALEARVVAHGGPADASSATAHARAGTDGLARGAELAAVTTPTLVVEAPEDPAYPPPSAALLARAVGAATGGARLVTVPGMGHALPAAVLGPLGDAVAAHLDAVDAAGGGTSG